jgi:hypothetical protein
MHKMNSQKQSLYFFSQHLLGLQQPPSVVVRPLVFMNRLLTFGGRERGKERACDRKNQPKPNDRPVIGEKEIVK